MTILHNPLLPEEEIYLAKVKDLLGNQRWHAEAYRGFYKNESGESLFNELALFYKDTDEKTVFKLSIYLDKDCNEMTLIIDPRQKWTVSIDYMSPYEFYFHGVYQILSCDQEMREWLHGMKPIFDRIHQESKDKFDRVYELLHKQS